MRDRIWFEIKLKKIKVKKKRNEKCEISLNKEIVCTSWNVIRTTCAVHYTVISSEQSHSELSRVKVTHRVAHISRLTKKL